MQRASEVCAHDDFEDVEVGVGDAPFVDGEPETIALVFVNVNAFVPVQRKWLLYILTSEPLVPAATDQIRLPTVRVAEFRFDQSASICSPCSRP